MEEMINITVTAISLGIGLVLGAFWMFVIMRKDELAMMEELDSKTRLLESYEAWVKNGGDKDEDQYDGKTLAGALSPDCGSKK